MIVLRLIFLADLSRLWPPFAAVSSLRRAPASPATAGVADPPSRRRSACARPWCRDLRRDLREVLPCERFGAFATDRACLFVNFFRYVFSDLRPRLPGRRRRCGRLHGSLHARIWENWIAPKNTCHPGFVENCHLWKILLREERDVRVTRILQQHVWCVQRKLLWWSYACCAVNVDTYGISYVQQYLHQQLRESYVYQYEQSSSARTAVWTISECLFFGWQVRTVGYWY